MPIEFEITLHCQYLISVEKKAQKKNVCEKSSGFCKHLFFLSMKL